jgi:4-hydroxybenzoate polyprenyltransferase
MPMSDRATLRAVRLLHPFPSAINAVLVAAIVLVAGGAASVALVMGAAMLAIQFSIGVTNDVFDQGADAGRPEKPLVHGDVSRRQAIFLSVALGAGGLMLAATRGVVELALLVVMYGAGLAYDAGLKRLGLGWLAYAVAFPLLPVYAWFGATGQVPPHAEILLPIAALAGPALALTNGLVDADSDREAGTRTIVVRLGRGLSLAVMVGLLLVIHAVAWLTPTARVPGVGEQLMAGGSLAAVAGVIGSASRRASMRERGWQLQVVATTALAAGWFIAVVLPPGPSQPV